MSYESIISLYENSSREIDRIFHYMIKFGASDLHIKSHAAPALRINGSIRGLDMPPLSSDQCEKFIFNVMKPEHIESYKKNGDVEFTHMLNQGHRFRISVYRERGTIALSARMIPNEIPSFESLALPRKVFERIADANNGLILLSGITGSGKSTSIATMIEHINQTRRCHIITIEDPIEFLYQDNKAFINQREIGSDVLEFENALKNLLRQDPDVIVVGEMRDYETFNFGITAAETGHLVFGTMHCASTTHVISRILDLYPAGQKEQIRKSLALNLRAVICQKLLPSTKEGHSMVPCLEILINNSLVKKMIMESEDQKILDAIKANRSEGMIDFTQSLADLIQNGYVSEEVGMEHAPNKESLRMVLQGIDLSDDSSIIS